MPPDPHPAPTAGQAPAPPHGPPAAPRTPALPRLARRPPGPAARRTAQVALLAPLLLWATLDGLRPAQAQATTTPVPTPTAPALTATLTASGGRYLLTLPYLEDAATGQAAYSARLSTAVLTGFTLEPGSVQPVALQTATSPRPSYSLAGGGVQLSVPWLTYAAGDTTFSYAAQLASTDGSAFRIAQASAGPAWGPAGGACRPVNYLATASTALAGTLKIEFEDIAQAEGMLHLRFTNVGTSPVFTTLELSSTEGRVGLMAPQPGVLALAPGQSLVGYVLYYGTGATGPATYPTQLSFSALNTTTGKPTGVTDKLQRSVSFVRPAETAITVTDAAQQLAFTRTALYTSRVGFWRYQVDANETRIVLFPGQENWTDASAAASAKLLAYDLDGRLLWEHAPGTETWGGDATSDGRYVAYATVATAGGGTSKLVLLDAATGTRLAERTLTAASLPTPAQAIAPTLAELDAREVRFNADGNLLAVGTSEGRGYLFDTATLTPRHAVQTGGQLRAIAFQGEHLYWGSGDGLLHKTRVADGSVVWRAYTSAWPYSEPAFSPDGQRVIVGAKSGGFAVLDTATGSCQFSANFGTVRRALFTPDGQHVVAATGAMTAGTVGYRVSDWQVAWRGPMSAAVSVTADSRYVLSADGKGALMDRDTGLRVATLDTGFASQANYFKTAYISKDGRRAVIARRDLSPGDAAIAFFRRP